MTRLAATVGAAACAVGALAGCGEKEEVISGPAPGERTPAQTSTPRGAPKADPKPKAREGRKAEPGDGPQTGGAPRSPEDQPGGAGDEIAARSQAMFTGRDGRVRPRLVRVPPFIAVRVELRAGDGRRYRLNGGGRTLSAGDGRPAAAQTFDGLRPGRRLVLRGTGGRVIVEASAEPGP